ncbi:hypothetical protein [Cryptosporangium minutisporangium]|uniref:DUF998 domain-containing protein n=1 Tax=Cryptosporangium minutisporangium TaxID=113569 RepID=A0ABP6T1H9_9ACTN
MELDNRATEIAGGLGGLLVSVVAGVDYAMGGKLVERHETVVDALHAVGFALMFAGALAVADRYRPRLSASGRVGLFTFASLLAGFAVVSIPGLAENAAVLGAVGSVCFLGMFVTGLVGGVGLWRRTDCSRLGAALLALGLPMIVVVVALSAVDWFPVHAAIAEIPVYLGLAVLAVDGLRLQRPVAASAVTG